MLVANLGPSSPPGRPYSVVPDSSRHVPKAQRGRQGKPPRLLHETVLPGLRPPRRAQEVSARLVPAAGEGGRQRGRRGAHGSANALRRSTQTERDADTPRKDVTAGAQYPSPDPEKLEKQGLHASRWGHMGTPGAACSPKTQPLGKMPLSHVPPPTLV